LLYNIKKSAVDAFNSMVENIRWMHRSRRWTVHVYQDLISFCIVNASILLRKETGIHLSAEEFVFGLYRGYLDQVDGGEEAK